MVKIREAIKKIFDTGGFHIIIGSFATKFVAFFGSIFVVRLLSKPEYGLLQYVENIYSYTLVIAGLGLPFALLRYVVIANDSKKKTIFEYTVKHSFIRDIIICILINMINYLVVYPDNFSEAKHLVPILSILLPFQNLVNSDLYALRALFKNKEFAYSSATISVLLIMGRVVGAKIDGATGVVWSRLLINLVISIIAFVFVYKLFITDGEKTYIALSKQEIREINSYSFQYMITSGLWVIFMLNDTFLLGLISNDPSTLADYKVAYVLPGNLSLIANAIGMYIAPYFTRNENSKIWVKKYFNTTILVNIIAVGLVSVLLIIFAKPLILMIYGEQYLNIVPLMKLLVLSAFLNSGLRYFFANVLSAMGKVKSNMIISSVGMAIQIGLDILLIHKYGATGVAISNCVAFTFMIIALFAVYYRNYYIE